LSAEAHAALMRGHGLDKMPTTPHAREQQQILMKNMPAYQVYFEDTGSSCLLDQFHARGDPTFAECEYPFSQGVSPKGCLKINPTYSCVPTNRLRVPHTVAPHRLR
jgi:hypothetical protein